MNHHPNNTSSSSSSSHIRIQQRESYPSTPLDGTTAVETLHIPLLPPQPDQDQPQRNVPSISPSMSQLYIQQQQQQPDHKEYNTIETTQLNAILEYQNKVTATNARAVQCTQQRQQQHVDLTWVQECFQSSTTTTTNTDMSLEYPMDADVHYNEIRRALSPYAQHTNHQMHVAKQFKGPWIENAYITHFESLYDNNHQLCLPDVFGPFIPILIPWVDHLAVTPNLQEQEQPQRRRHHYPDGLVRTLQSILRPNVPYITISQNDEGIVGKYEFNSTTVLPNLLVLSAGGYGNVPIPLLKQEEPYITDRIPIMDRPYDISYVGSLKNAPYGMRRKMHDILVRYNNTRTSAHKNDPHHRHFRYEYYYGTEWRNVVQHSKFSLVPRGFGRSAYHLMEVLQMGYIPIYVYVTNDTPWIPYMDVYLNEIGYMTDIDHLPDLLYYLHHNASNTELQFREARIAALRQTHFTMHGVVTHQIQQFMLGNMKKMHSNTSSITSTDLQCHRVPSTLTGKAI